MSRKFVYFLLFLLVVAAIFPYCKKVVQLNLKNATPQIVIEGEVVNWPGPYQVRISQTVDFSANNSFPPVSGAHVQITDSNDARTWVLKEAPAGVYTTDEFTGVSGHTYQLQVNVNGETYKASSTMPFAVKLDSITFSMNTDLNNNREINAVVDFQDPPGLANYYQFTEFVNGRQIPDIFVFEDRLSDGRYIQAPLYNDSSYLHPGDSLLLKMYCIDENIYNYFFTLIQASSNGNNTFQSVTPQNPVSNISNGALGYFSAHTKVEGSITVY